MIEHPQEADIRERSHANWLARGKGDGNAIDDWLIAQNQLFMELNYDSVSYVYSSLSETIHVSNDPVCRFCDLKRGDWSERRTKNGDKVPIRFSMKNAHAVPEFLGNKDMYAYDECKVCNELLFSKYENALKAWLGPYLDAERISGKSSCIVLNPEDGMRPRTESFKPEWVIKVLAKMAVGIAPRIRLGDFKHTKEWLQQDDRDDLNLVTQACPVISNLNCIQKSERERLGLGDRPSSVTLYSKKNSNAELHTHIFVIKVRAKAVQIVVPHIIHDTILSPDQKPMIVEAFPDFLTGRPILQDAFPELARIVI